MHLVQRESQSSLDLSPGIMLTCLAHVCLCTVYQSALSRHDCCMHTVFDDFIVRAHPDSRAELQAPSYSRLTLARTGVEHAQNCKLESYDMTCVQRLYHLCYILSVHHPTTLRRPQHSRACNSEQLAARMAVPNTSINKRSIRYSWYKQQVYKSELGSVRPLLMADVA
jgi:hypothetical protein